MSDPTDLAEARENAAAYWDGVARSHLDDANHANVQAWKFRTGQLDTELGKGDDAEK